MKKLKKIIFGMIFSSVISVIGISIVNAQCDYDNIFDTSPYMGNSGRFGCIQTPGVSFNVSNWNDDKNIKTVITSWNDAGWSNLYSIGLGAPNGVDTNFYLTNYGIQSGYNACNFASGVSNVFCSIGYNNYDFATYPVNSSSVAYSSEPTAFELGVLYNGGSTTNSRMETYAFENNLGANYDSGTYDIDFYFSIGYQSDTDWNDFNKVKSAFNFTASTLFDFYTYSNARSVNYSNNNSYNTSEGYNGTMHSATINSISVDWYSFSTSIPYVKPSGNIAGNWYVAHIKFNITSDYSFQAFRFKYNAHNTSYWADGSSFYQNLIFAGAYVNNDIFVGLQESYLTLNSDNNFSMIFSNLPSTGRIIFENIVKGSAGTNSQNNNMTLSDLNGAIYYIKLNGSNIFDAGSTQIIGYKSVYCSTTENSVCYYYIDYDFGSHSSYDGLAFISSGIATEIVGDEYQKNSTYCNNTYGSSWLGNFGKKVCNFYSRTPLLNKIITKNREKDLKKGTYYSFKGVYNVKIWTSDSLYVSDLSYNNNHYSWDYKSNGVVLTNNGVNGVLTKSDLVGNLDFSLIMPTLTVMNTDINTAVNTFTTGRDSSIFVFLFSFLLSIMTIAILKAGVKH